MLELKTYDKYEIAAELNIDAKKTCNITRKLTSLGYRFSTSGRGDTYTITILEIPKEGIKEFAQKYLNVDTVRFNDRLAHFLITLTLEKQPQAALCIGNQFREHELMETYNMTPSALEWITPACDDTIGKWIKGFIKAGLLIEEECVDTYYATYKLKISDENSEDAADYLYTRKCVKITKEEFEKAAEAYNKTKTEYLKDYDTNWHKVTEEGEYLAHKKKLEVLEYFLAKRKESTISLNKAWPHYQELLELLKKYPYEPFEKWEHGNYEKEFEEKLKRQEEWEKKKELRRIEMLGEEEAKKIKEQELKAEEEAKKVFKNTNNKEVCEILPEIEVYIDEPYKNAVFDTFEECAKAFEQYVHKMKGEQNYVNETISEFQFN